MVRGDVDVGLKLGDLVYCLGARVRLRGAWWNKQQAASSRQARNSRQEAAMTNGVWSLARLQSIQSVRSDQSINQSKQSVSQAMHCRRNSFRPWASSPRGGALAIRFRPIVFCARLLPSPGPVVGWGIGAGAANRERPQGTTATTTTTGQPWPGTLEHPVRGLYIHAMAAGCSPGMSRAERT